MRAIALEAIQLSRPLAAERAITIAGGGKDRTVIADPVRLRQVILNLVSNAIKYNRDHGAIRVQLAAEQTTATLSIIDTGPGISDDQLPRLFIPFDRLDADRTTVKGTGVGLAVVKQLVELMHGTIDVQSRLGIGTCFSITLSLAADGPTATVSADERLSVS